MREYSFRVHGRIPAFNEIIDAAKGYGGRGLGYSKMKKEWTNSIIGVLRRARVWVSKDVPDGFEVSMETLPKLDRISLAFHWTEPNRKRDPDNVAVARKFVLDAMVEAGLIANDGWAQIAGWRDSFEVGPDAGVSVTVTEVPPEARKLQRRKR